MKKIAVILICLCLFLAVSCSENGGNKDNKDIYTLVAYDGAVFENLAVEYFGDSFIRGCLPDGTKVWASGNWYVIKTKSGRK